MARGYLDKSGNYYESDGDFGDTPVPNRPSVDHAWDGETWTLSTALRAARLVAEKEAELAEFNGPALGRLLVVLAARFGVTPQALLTDLRNAQRPPA